AGTFELKHHMSSAAALNALMDPDNRVSQKLAVPEGMRMAEILDRTAKVTGISLDKLQKAAADISQFAVPKQAKTLEGFLYPATYTFDPGVTADKVLTRMVTRTDKELDDLGVAE